MRIAALFDIHGNLPALEAVLTEVRQAKVDAIVAGGDVIPGPMATNTLRGLAVPVHFIHGNAEVAILTAMKGQDHPWVPDEHRPLIRWAAEPLRLSMRPSSRVGRSRSRWASHR